MNETIINLLQLNSAEKVGKGGKKEERRYHRFRFSLKKIPQEKQQLGLSGQCDNWPYHRIMTAAMKKNIMVLPERFARSPG